MRPYTKTRQWTHPEGYKFLVAWTNAVLLRFLIRKFTETLPRSEYRSKTQFDDAADTMAGDARLLKVKIEYSVSAESD